MSFQGFGEPSGEFWLGNEFVSRMTTQQSYKLRIQLSDWEGNSEFSQYDQFSLNSEAQNYRYVVLTTSKNLMCYLLGKKTIEQVIKDKDAHQHKSLSFNSAFEVLKHSLKALQL